MSRKATQNLASIRALQIQKNRSNPLEGAGYDSDDSYSSEGSLYGGNDGLMPLRMVGSGKKSRSKRLGKAHKLGSDLGKEIHHLHGAGFFDDFKKGFNSVVAPVAGIAKNLLPLAGPEGAAASGVIGALGYGRLGENGHGQFNPYQELKPRGGKLGENGHGQLHSGGLGMIRGLHSIVNKIKGGKMSKGDRRRMLVKKIMEKMGISMTAASKYIREHKLKY
jgi:hypothetical protein